MILSTKNKSKKKILLMILTFILSFSLVVPSLAYGTPTFSGLAKKQTYSQSDVKWVIKQAAVYYKLSSSDTIWLQNAAVDIIFRLPGKPAHESGGNTHASPSGACRGIVQFNGAWSPGYKPRKMMEKYEPWHKNNWRLSGIASLYRMTKVMKDGGKSAVRRHWRATLGR